jgi:putative acetyltransferase
MDYPKEWRKTIKTKNGKTVLFRPVQPTDTEMLWQMFSTLSQTSLSNLIPPFTRERIESWTNNIDYNNVLAIEALIKENNKEKIIASASLKFYPQESLKHKAELGITVHDNYQNIGIGSELINHLLNISKKKKLKKVWLNVRPSNKPAIHVYTKAGFEIEATLRDECYINGKYEDRHQMAIFLR